MKEILNKISEIFALLILLSLIVFVIWVFVHYLPKDGYLVKRGVKTKGVILSVKGGKSTYVDYSYIVNGKVVYAYFHGIDNDRKMIGDTITIIYDPKDPGWSQPAFDLYPNNPEYKEEFKKESN